MTKAPLLASLLLLPLCALAAGAPANPIAAPVLATLHAAEARHAPVLLDFHAPWCHSCYFMEKHVLTGSEWQAFQKKALVVSLDTDTPEGAYWKKQYKLVGVPSYVLVDGKGKELGRIVGDMPRQQFYNELARISRKDGGFARLQAKAAGKGKLADEAALAALVSYRSAIDGAGGLAWWQSLPEARRSHLLGIPAIANALDWVKLTAAAEGPHPDAPRCQALAGPLLAEAQSDCGFAANLSTVSSCMQGLPEAERKSFFAPYRPTLDALVRNKVISDPPVCSDNRDPVELAVDLAELSGDSAYKNDLLAAAIAHGQRQLKAGVSVDKSIADNQRVFLEQAGRLDELEAFLLDLIKAYPEDYVYANRMARLLAQRGKHEAALPYFASAAEKAYGVNKLRNMQEYVKSLIALGRKPEAQQLAATVLAENGPWFEEDVAKLKALLA